jgi:hypothetical protein
MMNYFIPKSVPWVSMVGFFRQVHKAKLEQDTEQVATTTLHVFCSIC